MNNNDKIKKSIVESIVVISIMALYIVYGIHFVPLFMLFIPLPFVVLGVRNGIYSNVISIVITSLIVGILLGFSSATSLLLIFTPLSLSLNYCIKSRKSNTETILICTAAFFLSFIIPMFLGRSVSNLDLVKQLEQTLTQTLTMQIDMFKEMGMTNYQILKATDLLENSYKLLVVLVPSLLGIVSLIISYVNFLLISLVLRKMGYGIVIPQRFSRFKLPSNIIPGIGVMLLTAFIIKKLEIQYHQALLFNITFLVSFIFFMQGLAVLDYLLLKAKIRLVFRIIILTMNIIFIPMGSVIFFIGVLDTILDMRKIRKQKSL